MKLKVQDILDLNIGDIRFECNMHQNIEFKVLTKPVQSGDEIKWEAENTQSGRLIHYMLNINYQAYAPKIYDEPQYYDLRNMTAPLSD